MESEVIQRLASIADADARDDANLLQKRVATLMLPESRNDPAVTREVLSVWLGAGSRGYVVSSPFTDRAGTAVHAPRGDRLSW